jgi:hypothetical protein
MIPRPIILTLRKGLSVSYSWASYCGITVAETQRIIASLLGISLSWPERDTQGKRCVCKVWWISCVAVVEIIFETFFALILSKSSELSLAFSWSFFPREGDKRRSHSHREMIIAWSSFFLDWLINSSIKKSDSKTCLSGQFSLNCNCSQFLIIIIQASSCLVGFGQRRRSTLLVFRVDVIVIFSAILLLDTRIPFTRKRVSRERVILAMQQIPRANEVNETRNQEV